MSMKELPSWLMANQGFHKSLTRLTIESVRRQFENVQPSQDTSVSPEQLGYLLTCASVLAHSDDGVSQDAALRIAQFSLSQHNVSDGRRDAAAFVLDALVNKPAIRLAEARQLLEKGYEHRIPLVAQQESIKRRLEYSIELSDQSFISTNKFQTSFWDTAKNNLWVSVSAPTSAGKSFILETWIQDHVAKRSSGLVIYLVPTRALIAEVESDLHKKFLVSPDKINIASLPLKSSYVPGKANILVFTQERFHIFLNAFDDAPLVTALIVDEAHKIGDRHRGVFLQQVIELATRNNEKAHVIFASPFTENPEALIEDAPRQQSAVIKTRDVTVNQNLIWVNQEPRTTKKWRLLLCLQKEIADLGIFDLENTPSPDSKRLPFVAVALSGNKPGNIVYVNGAADAEKAARQIYDVLGDQGLVDSELAALIELCEKTIHKNFLLNMTLRRGVAFHYGNMPLLVKGEIERLFSANKIKFLVCTSTLVEGVNMACKNIFVRGPKKGRSVPMNAEDFWNLAGRAGRWGKEFQGNVFCVDANRSEIWKDGAPPRSKAGVKIHRTTDEVINNTDVLIEYIQSKDHLALSQRHPDKEYVFSYLFSTYLQDGSLRNNPALKQDPSVLILLEEVLKSIADKIQVPLAVIKRNPGISPLLMDSLMSRFGRDPDKPIDRLLLAEPSSQDALDSYTAAFNRISSHLSQAISFTPKQAYIRALLVVRWMRGFPLARLISDRIRYARDKGETTTDASLIRSVMTEVEEIARYQAPRLLSCYNDLLTHFFNVRGRADLSAGIQDISVYLELGLNQETQISLVGIGLSRTAAVMISELISNDSLTLAECVSWLKDNDWKNADLPHLVKEEISKALDSYLLRSR